MQLTNEGFERGTEAYNNAMQEYGQNVNDAHMAVIAQGGNEQDRAYNERMGALQNDNAVRQAMFSNQLQGAEFRNTSLERALQQQLAVRQAPLNEASAILSGGQVNMPQFSPYQGGTVANTPVGDYVYRGYDTQMRGYSSEVQAQATQNAAMFGAGASLLGGLFKMSDRRLKRDVTRIGEYRGVGLYLYRYNWSDEWQAGVMADEVALVAPHAVTTRGGVQLVNYGAL